LGTEGRGGEKENAEDIGRGRLRGVREEGDVAVTIPHDDENEVYIVLDYLLAIV